MMRIVLASASPARAALLHGAGLTFDIVPSSLDEAAVRDSLKGDDLLSEDLAQILAEAKAAEVSARHPGALVIGADQILAFQGETLSKPETLAKAYQQLWRLRGRAHRLSSAVACIKDGTTEYRHAASADLTMRDFSREFLSVYIEKAGDAVLTSVGAYQLEGLGAQLFEEIRGDYFTILGLPLLPLLAYLRQAGALPT